MKQGGNACGNSPHATGKCLVGGTPPPPSIAKAIEGGAQVCVRRTNLRGFGIRDQNEKQGTTPNARRVYQLAFGRPEETTPMKSVE